MAKNAHKTANILGFKLFSNRKSELLKKIKIHLSNKTELLVIFTPNGEQLVQTQQNPNFNRCLHQADLLIPDGMSLVWSSRLLSLRGQTEPIRERIAGVDLVQDLLNMAAQNNFDCLVVGGEDYNRAPAALKEKGIDCWKLKPHLYWTPGYKNIDAPTGNEKKNIKDCLSSIKPDIVFTAFGAPQQEQWIISNKSLLEQHGVKLAMAVGGAFDLILGKLRRAPRWMGVLGLEWLFRLIQEPWRWRRQTRLVAFVGLVVQQFFAGEKSS